MRGLPLALLLCAALALSGCIKNEDCQLGNLGAFVGLVGAGPQPLAPQGALGQPFSARASFDLTTGPDVFFFPREFFFSGLPPGLTGSQFTGAITGTPQVPGVFTVSITVIHDVRARTTCPRTTRDSVNLTIIGLLITTNALRNGTIAQPYSDTLQAVGGVGNHIWSFDPNSPLPPSWLNINPVLGTLSGTPPSAGPVNLTVKVQDTSAPPLTATKGFTLNVLSDPVINSLSPSTIQAGGTSFPLTVDGSGFLPGAVVLWNGAGRMPTTFLSSAQLTVNIPSADIQAAGITPVQVQNPDGVTSNQSPFTITSAPLNNPSITSLSPSSKVAGDPGFTLTISGTNFRSSSTVLWNGSPRATNFVFVSQSQLMVDIPASDLVTAGVAQVQVSNPLPNAGASNIENFTINNPVPTIISVSPPTAPAGRPGPLLTVMGTNFVSTSLVQWNGVPRQTTFVSSVELQVQLLNADVLVAGTGVLQVFNPLPGGGSAFLVPDYPINNPLPSITAISPNAALVNSPDTPLTVDGADFVQGAVVRVDLTTVLPTTFVSGTRLTTSIPASALTTAGTLLIDVLNPPPGGGAAAGFPFQVQAAPAGPVGVVATLSPSSTSPSTALEQSARPWLSADGQIAAFRSDASDLVSGDTNLHYDIFARRHCANPFLPCVNPFNPSTIRVSIANDGSEGRDFSLPPPPGSPTVTFGSAGASISPDGRYVAFNVRHFNLVPNDTQDSGDIFLYDTCVNAPLGCQAGLIRLSETPGGGQADGESLLPAVSAFGRFVAYQSLATNLVANDTNIQTDVFVRDTCNSAPLSCLPQTVRVSVDPSGAQLSISASRPIISADGRFVAYTGNGQVPLFSGRQVYVHDRDTDEDGIFDEPAAMDNYLVSVAPDGITPGNSNTRQEVPALSADGRYVAFASPATNLVPGDTNGLEDIFVRDTCRRTGTPGVIPGCTPITVRGAVAGLFTGVGYSASLSGDGRYLAFTSVEQLDPADTNTLADIYVQDRDVDGNLIFDETNTPGFQDKVVTRLASRVTGGAQADMDCLNPSLSYDGTVVAFDTKAANLSAPRSDTNSDDDVFLATTGFTPPAGAPVIALLSPSSAPAGSLDINVVVTGTGFTADSVARWNGAARPTIVFGSGRLLMRAFATDLAGPGPASAQITVFNPTTQVTSNAAPFNIQ